MRTKLNGFLTLLLAVIVHSTFAQDKTITGTVTDQDGLPLPGVNILVVGTTSGTQTDFDGNYAIKGSEGQALLFTYIGQKNEKVTIGASNTINVQMTESAQALEEVVLTGVAQGTSKKKLPFIVETVPVAGVQTVPTPDAASALIGKVAGAQIVQGGGNPLRNSAIILRGASSIEGSTAPLIIVDGVITQGSLSDFSTQDFESIEVVKGAAASSLYGSLAGNGVIQIITKKGTTDKPRVNIRQENGFSNIQRGYPLAKNHDRLLDANGNFDVSSGGIVADPDGLFDNPWPGQIIDNVDRLLTTQPYQLTTINVSQKLDKIGYFASLEDNRVGGLIDGLEETKRQNARLNMTVNMSDRFKVDFTNYVVRRTGQEVQQGGQGDNLFFNLLTGDPTTDLEVRDENGGFVPFYPDNGFIGEYQNPLYVARQQRNTVESSRLISGITAKYSITDNLFFEGQISTDRGSTQFEEFFPKGYISGAQGNPNTDNGFYSILNAKSARVNSYAQLNFNKTFGDFGIKSSVRYLFEDIKSSFNRSQSSNFLTEGVRNLQQGTENIFVFSGQFREKTQNLFFSADLDWKEKLILGGFVRTDRSSLFGEDNRDQVFYRGSLAYRLSEDFESDVFTELKLRASYGTAGLRPNFGDIFETFSVAQTGISPVQIGNPNLQSPDISELEVGLDFTLWDKIDASFTYANSQTEGAIITVPLSGAVPGTVQRQNVAETEYTSFEASIKGTAIETEDFQWTFGITAFTVDNQIVSLGDVAPFNRNIVDFGDNVINRVDSAPAVNVFRVEPGQPYGAMFGNTLVKSLDDLTVEDGLVINEGLNLPISDFSVNEFGHVIVTANEGETGLVGTGEQAIRKWNADTNQLEVGFIGDTNPDFNMGFRNTFTYKNMSLYTLIDAQFGGDVYNYSRQFLYFNDRHADLDTFGAAGQPSSYANASSTIYNGAAPIDYFVEDASFVKIREISLSYTFDKEILGPQLPLEAIKLTLSGRNLWTFTDYTGYDPEVALAGSPIFRIDEFTFPNFRLFAGSILITF
ncbi:SusC/RagA family TonB-linked outer membrane protein [Maribacter sp. 2-571]|uniref:SusC/RagA family TonB-linked outer membrane protein n=1 Tax=Maribacter sp. 2-571 TaxID=3417569 RepID=UPI003D32E6C6